LNNPKLRPKSTDICRAAAEGDVSQVRLLVGQGIAVDSSDYDMRTALHLAASEGQLRVVQVLVDELGASTGVVDRWGHMPLDDAVVGNHASVAKFLQDRGSTSSSVRVQPTTAKGTSDRSIKDIAADLCDAAARGDIELIRQLAQRGSPVLNKGDYDARTALHLAASEGLLEVVKVLVDELGASTSPLDRWNGTPLDDAVRSKHDRVAQFLMQRGASPGELHA